MEYVIIFYTGGGTITIGAEIRKLRLAVGMTQNELSEGIMNRVGLNRIEMGKSVPTIEQSQKLASRLGIPVTSFIVVSPIENDIHKVAFAEQNVYSCLYNEGRYEELIESTNDICNHRSCSFSLLFYRGMSLYNSNRISEAHTVLTKYSIHYEKCLTDYKSIRTFEYATAQNSIGKFHITSMNFLSAELHFKKGIYQLEVHNRTFNKLYYILHSNLIRTLNQANRYIEAKVLIEKIFDHMKGIIFESATASLHQSASVTYKCLKDLDKSHFHLHKAILLYQHDDNNEQAGLCCINQFNIYREQHMWEEAQNYIDNIKLQFSINKQTYHILTLQSVMILINTEQYGEAESRLSEISFIKLRQIDKATYQYLKGIIHLMKNDFLQASKCYSYAESSFIKRKYYFDIDAFAKQYFKITGDPEILNKSQSLDYSSSILHIYLQRIT